MVLFDKITRIISQIVTFFPNNGKLPDFSYKITHFKFSDVLSLFFFPLRILKQCIKKKCFIGNLRDKSSCRNDPPNVGSPFVDQRH